MIGKLTLAAGLIAAAAAFAPAGASSVATPQTRIAPSFDASMVEQVKWGRCRGWRQECASRHGWGTPRYHRCLGRHGC